jgi:hypothetical protein
MMKYTNIHEILTENDHSRDRFCTIVNAVTDEEAGRRLDGEKWTIAEIVEHVSMVNAGIAKICLKLLRDAQADGKPADQTLAISPDLQEKVDDLLGRRVEAPERVQPTGGTSIEESLVNLGRATRDIKAMGPEMERYDLSGHRFPHPYFGEITAIDWLIVMGRHELRHGRQIEGLLAKMRS